MCYINFHKFTLNSCIICFIKDDKPASSSNKRELEIDEETKKDTSLSTKKLCPTVDTTSIKLKGYFAERQGERESMQDRHIIIEDFSKYLKKIPEEM